MRLGRVGIAVLVVGVALIGSSGIVTAATSPKPGTIAVWSEASTGTTAKIVFAGVFGDYGKATSIDKNGKPDIQGSYERVVLQKGTFQINAVALTNKGNSTQPIVDSSANCSFAFTVKAPTTIYDGTGAYKNISGTIQITEFAVGIIPRVKSGKHKGSCDNSNSAKPTVFGGAVTGKGTVSF